VEKLFHQDTLLGVSYIEGESGVRHINDRKLDVIHGQRVMDPGNFVRFYQGRLHQAIVQSRQTLVQHRSFVLCTRKFSKHAVAALVQLIHSRPQLFHTQESFKSLAWQALWAIDPHVNFFSLSKMAASRECMT
jgi:hypothetical protein